MPSSSAAVPSPRTSIRAARGKEGVLLEARAKCILKNIEEEGAGSDPDGLVQGVIAVPFSSVNAAAAIVKYASHDENVRLERIGNTGDEHKYHVRVPLYLKPLLGTSVVFFDRTVDKPQFRVEVCNNISLASIAQARECMIYAPHPDPALAETHTMFRKEVRVDAGWVPRPIYNYIMSKYLEGCAGVREKIVGQAAIVEAECIRARSVTRSLPPKRHNEAFVERMVHLNHLHNIFLV